MVAGAAGVAGSGAELDVGVATIAGIVGGTVNGAVVGTVFGAATRAITGTRVDGVGPGVRMIGPAATVAGTGLGGESGTKGAVVVAFRRVVGGVVAAEVAGVLGVVSGVGGTVVAAAFAVVGAVAIVGVVAVVGAVVDGAVVPPDVVMVKATPALTGLISTGGNVPDGVDVVVSRTDVVGGAVVTGSVVAGGAVVLGVAVVDVACVRVGGATATVVVGVAAVAVVVAVTAIVGATDGAATSVLPPGLQPGGTDTVGGGRDTVGSGRDTVGRGSEVGAASRGAGGVHPGGAFGGMVPPGRELPATRETGGAEVDGVATIVGGVGTLVPALAGAEVRRVRAVVVVRGVVDGTCVDPVVVGGSVGTAGSGAPVLGCSTTVPLDPSDVICTASTRAIGSGATVDEAADRASFGRFRSWIPVSAARSGTGGRTAFGSRVGVTPLAEAVPCAAATIVACSCTGATAASASRITTAPAMIIPTTRPRVMFMTLE